MRKRLSISLTAVALLSMMAPTQAVASGSNAMAPSGAAVPSQPAAPKAGEARTVTGTVTDAVDGTALAMATVSVVGDVKTVAVADADGNFTIKLKAGLKNPHLQVTYVGYKKAIVPVEDLAHLQIAMEPEGNSLNEVVVVGAGVQKKVSVTGAISQLKGDDLKISASTLTNSLAGKFAGVFANNTSGQPGSGAEFYIRGISNFAGKSATPLILLDDVEISAADLNYIPAENIKSFSVLKDASATAIYGARGANGVMIITTKGGDYNTKTNINVTVENAFNVLSSLPEFVDGARYMEMFNFSQKMRNPLELPKYSQDDIDRTRSHENPYLYPDVDWQSVLFKQMAMRQRANVNVSGGGSKVKYYMSLEVNHEDGHYKTEKLYSWDNNITNWNYTFQNNLSYKLTPTTTVSMNMNAQIRKKSSPNVASSTLFNYASSYNPTLMPYWYDPSAVQQVNSNGDVINGEDFGHYIYPAYVITGGHRMVNPYAVLNTSYAESNENTLNTVIKINQELDFITQGLKFQGWVNFKNWSSKSFTRSINPYYYEPKSGQIDREDWNQPGFRIDLQRSGADDATNYIAESAVGTSGDNTYEIQTNLNWQRKFNDVHDLSAMVLYRMREYRGGSVLPNRNQGVSARATYDYDSRYLVEFNMGYNGTERLAKGHRFGFFPAGSLGWVVSNEKFWEPLASTVSLFKLRGSYGLVGSDAISGPKGTYFFYLDQIAGGTINGLTWTPGAGRSDWGTTYGGPQISYYGVTDLGWEKVKKLDLGIDLRFWDNLNVTIDLFRDYRYNIFMQRACWPGDLGYGDMMPYSAIGEIENKGIEGSVSYNHTFTPDLSVSFTGNFTYNVNKLINGDELNYRYKWQKETGLPLNHIRGYIAEGLFRSQEEIDNSPEQKLGSTPLVGDIKYRDLNGDGVINTDDQTMIADCGSTPRLQYGFGATVRYKNFDAGFFFTGSGKRMKSLNGLMPFMYINAPSNVMKWIADNCFDPEKENFDALFPRLGVGEGYVANNTVASTHWLRNASFCRLRNVEVGYNFSLGRVYLSGVNLLNFTSFKYWDPELGNWNSYPLQKTVNVGIQLNI